MKSAYIKPETEILSANIEAILNITSNQKDGRDPSENPITPGGENEDVGAKRFDFDWDLEDFNDFKDTWE